MNRRFFGSAVIGALASFFGIKTAKAAVEREEVGWLIQYQRTDSDYIGHCFYLNGRNYYGSFDDSKMGPWTPEEYAKLSLKYYEGRGISCWAYPVYK